MMQVSKSFKRVVLLELAITVGFLVIGLYHGLIQIIYRAGIVQKNDVINPGGYQPVTAGDMLYGAIPGSFFMVAFGHIILTYYCKTEPGKKSMWAGFLLMITGLLLIAINTLYVNPDQLYDSIFVTPCHPVFYVGLLLLLTGACIPIFSWIEVYRQWKKVNTQQRLPIAVAGVLTGAICWQAGSIVVIGAIISTLIPWLPGGMSVIDTSLARDLFLYAGRILPYFWLLPVFIFFYTLLPQVAGGKLSSDSLARISLFVLFLYFMPVDVFYPSSPFRELSLIIPCFITSILVLVSLEDAGRQNGAAKNLFNWIERLPYFDETKYLFAYGICAFLLFTTGSTSVLVNSLNTVSHTANPSPWLDNFYMLVAGPALPVMAGISLYFYTTLSGKNIRWPRLNVTLPYLWIIGILILSLGAHWDMLRSGPGPQAGNQLFHPDWIKTSTLVLLGELVLFVTGLLFILIVAGTVFSPNTKPGTLQLPVTEGYRHRKQEALWHRLMPWLLLTTTAMLFTGLLFFATDRPANAFMAVQNISGPVPALPQQTSLLPVKQDYGLLLGFLASVGVFILILLFCVQTSGLQRKLRSQKSSFPG